ncbi:MAG: YbaB/EbfC family nucleoid-associated protein [Kiritimatiellia bacterium]
MANFMNMMKQASSMRKNLKDIQKKLAGKKVEHSAQGGKIKVTARGDMSLESIEIDPELIDRGKAAELEQAVTGAVNEALAKARKQAGKEVSGLAGGLGL